jgi:prevent-host-death family protein
MNGGTTVTILTLSSRTFNHDLGSAKRAALGGPVFITDRGEPRHVLMSYREYQKLTGLRRNLVEALAMHGGEDVDFESPRIEFSSRPADLF